ncbi:MAG: DNA ligase [Lachnospiraceae bacterium]|nr:DNA ligase [Lachnospiraceae bacterium]
MSKMKDLSMVLDELVTCGETLISTANVLKEIFSDTAAPDPAPKSNKKNAAAKPAASSEKAEEPKPTKALTKEDVRGILAAKSSAGHSDEVRSLLAKYGAKQLKQVDPKDYETLVQEAEVIGNE